MEVGKEYIAKDVIIDGVKRTLSLTIMQDVHDNTESPRMWDNVGIMVCFHKRYNLGDKNDLNADMFGSWEEMEEYLIKEKKAVCILPLYLYDHSGLRIKVVSFYGLLPQGHAEFDSGQAGFIYATKESVTKIMGKCDKKIRESVRDILIEEVEVYDQYLRDDIYGFILDEIIACPTCGNTHREHIDSCYGFYGSDLKANGMFDSIPHIEHFLKQIEV